jgi:hypothetical protein
MPIAFLADAAGWFQGVIVFKDENSAVGFSQTIVFLKSGRWIWETGISASTPPAPRLACTSDALTQAATD